MALHLRAHGSHSNTPDARGASPTLPGTQSGRASAMYELAAAGRRTCRATAAQTAGYNLHRA